MGNVSPREVLARVASVIVGSLAAGYHLLGDKAGAQVQTKGRSLLTTDGRLARAPGHRATVEVA